MRKIAVCDGELGYRWPDFFFDMGCFAICFCCVCLVFAALDDYLDCLFYLSHFAHPRMSRFNKKTKYLFYPAQYWAHKNHIYILKALKILKSEEIADVGAIFTGSDKGNLSFLKEYAFKNDLIPLGAYVR